MKTRTFTGIIIVMAFPCIGYCVHARNRYERAMQELEEVNSTISKVSS